MWYAIGAIALLAGVAIRLQLAAVAQTPGHGDSAFYFTVAKNIADGRGIVVDYVVYFFLGLVPITHYAGDFWNPLAEILLSLPLLVLGKSLFNALLASIAAGVVLAAVGFMAGREFGRSTSSGVLVGVLTFFTPFMIVESVRTEAIIFFGALGALGLLLAALGRHRPRYFLIAALCTGLAHLTRQDGILLLAAVLLCVAVAPFSTRQRLAIGAGVLAIHTAAISPLLIRNLATYGTPLQPGPASTAFMTSYEDFHAYNKEMSWDTLRAEWGLRRILNRRLHTAGENLAQVKLFMDPIVLYLASLGLVSLALTRRQERRIHVLLPPLIYWVLVYAFYSIVASFSGPGSLPKSLAVLLPFACILIADLLISRLQAERLIAAAAIALAILLGYRGYTSSYGAAMLWNSTYENYGRLRAAIETDLVEASPEPASVVLMARDVWDVYEGTGFKSIMIPNNDLETILQVAQHYGVDYMLLPAPRPALDDIYSLAAPDPRFRYVTAIEGTDWRLFRLELPAP